MRRSRSVDGDDLRLDVAHELEVLRAARCLLVGERDRLAGDRDVGFPRGGDDADRTSAQVELGQDQQVVRQEGLHGCREPREHFPDVERLGERCHQRLEQVEALPPAALGVPDAPMLDRRAQKRRDRPQELLVLIVEGIGAMGAQPHAAAPALGHAEGRPQGRPDALFDQERVHGELRVQLDQAVVQPLDGARPRAHARRPGGQGLRLGALRLMLVARHGRRVEHRRAAIEDPHDSHVVEGDEPVDRGPYPVEDLLQLQGLRCSLGHLGEHAGQRWLVDGSGTLRHMLQDGAHAAKPNTPVSD